MHAHLFEPEKLKREENIYMYKVKLRQNML